MAALSYAVLSNVLVFMLIAGMAGSCDSALLKKAFKRLNGIGAGLVCQFVLLPLLGFLSLTAFPQSPSTAVTLLVVTTSPGGGFSGWWCFLCNADLALSVAMTTASTIVSVFALPVNLYLYITLLYGRSVEIDFLQLCLSVAIVVVAVVVGATIGNLLPTKRKAVSLIGQVAGVALMAVGAMANTTSSDPLWENPWTWFAAMTSPVIGGLSVAIVIARCVRLTNPESVAVAIECCYQNTGLALTIALSAVPRDDRGAASGVPIVYGMAEMALIPLFALSAWKLGWTYAPPEENVCIVLAGNYQPEATGPTGTASPSRLAAAATSLAQDTEALNPKDGKGGGVGQWLKGLFTGHGRQSRPENGGTALR